MMSADSVCSTATVCNLINLSFDVGLNFLKSVGSISGYIRRCGRTQTQKSVADKSRDLGGGGGHKRSEIRPMSKYVGQKSIV